MTTARTASNGNYKPRYVPSTPGRLTLRVVSAATPALLAGTSLTRVLTVT